MANYKVTDSELSGIASAIRLKGGTSDPLVFPSGFVSAISAIETQGTYISKTITSNGEYDPASDNADAFSHVTVSIPSAPAPVLVSKAISENGVYNPASDDADGFSQVIVSVSGGGSNNDYGLAVAIKAETGSVYVSTVTSLNGGALRSNSYVTAIEFPEVTALGGYCFANCTNLVSASLPKCSTLLSYDFQSCNSLLSVNVPQVEFVGSNTFVGCQYLSKISLPKCSRIKTYAFSDCYRLLSVYLLNENIVTLDNPNAFRSSPVSGYTNYTNGVLGSIYVPSSLVDSYKVASSWSAYADRITSYVEE